MYYTIPKLPNQPRARIRQSPGLPKTSGPVAFQVVLGRLTVCVCRRASPGLLPGMDGSAVIDDHDAGPLGTEGLRLFMALYDVQYHLCINNRTSRASFLTEPSRSQRVAPSRQPIGT